MWSSTMPKTQDSPGSTAWSAPRWRRAKEFVTVPPGIRFADAKADDQVRITTPAKAREIGSDYIVVGRPITQAEDPVAAYRRCVSEFVG